MEITTHHRNEDGEQITTRTVELKDATGSTTSYDFEVVDDDHHYVGEGEPSDRALEALAEFEEASADE